MRVAISFGSCGELLLHARAPRRRALPGSSPRMRRSNSARCVGRRARRGAASQALRAALRALAGGAPGVEHVGRESRTARAVQPSFSRAPSISSAPSGEPCALAVPALVGAPKPMVVWQAISVGRSDALRLLDRGGDRVRIVAVDARRRSSRRPRSASPGRPSRRATAGRRSRCRCRRTARSAC